MIEDHLLSEGILNGAGADDNKVDRIHISVERNQYGLISDFQNLIRDYGGKQYDGSNVVQKNKGDGPVTIWPSPDGALTIIMRHSPESGPTLEVQFKNPSSGKLVFSIKRRYKEF